MRTLLIILSQPGHDAWAHEVAAAGGVTSPVVLTASPAEAAHFLAEHRINPSHIVLDIGQRSHDILPEIDALAQQCEPGTRVIATGNTNDIGLYREILARGVADYLPMPADPQTVIRALTTAPATTTPAPAPAPAPTTAPADIGKRVIVFMSAASGDGASTAALNCAWAISQHTNGRTILVDMDYQFGMVAKQLGLQNQYGIRDLFDFPDRGVDATLIKRMVASYGKLDVITAPAELRFLPVVSAEAIRDLIATLKLTYDTILIDLPHAWLPWSAAAAAQSTHIVLVSQLWLKSVSHASRLMRTFRELNIPAERIIAVVNRHGARFKEAIDPKDFERVCGIPIRFTLSNDIRTVVAAEAEASTVMQQPPSDLAADIQRLTRYLLGLSQEDALLTTPKRGLFSRKG